MDIEALVVAVVIQVVVLVLIIQILLIIKVEEEDHIITDQTRTMPQEFGMIMVK